MSETLRLPERQEYHETTEQEFIRKELWGEPPKIIARFYIDAEKDFNNSTKDCPIYIEQTMVFLQVVGEKDSLTAIATDDHKAKYPKEWALFERNKDRRTIPLSALPKMRPSVSKAMADLGVTCVEDVIEKELPEYLQPYKKWAQWIKSVHENAEGRKLKVAV